MIQTVYVENDCSLLSQHSCSFLTSASFLCNLSSAFYKGNKSRSLNVTLLLLFM